MPDVSERGYIYVLSLRDGNEIVAYHWHPSQPDVPAFPHLHIGPASARPDAPVRAGELHKVHFPTGTVSLPAFLRLAIVEFGVEPRRPDWAEILSASER